MDSQEHDSRVNILRSSMRSSMLRCPRQWAWRYGLGLATNDDPLPLSFGRLWHHIIEIIYETQDGMHEHREFPCPAEHVWTRCRARVQEAADEWLDLRLVSTSQSLEGEDSAAMADLVVDMASRYVLRWLTPEEDQQWTVVSLEGEAEAPLPTKSGRPSPVDRYAGRWDGLFCEGPLDDPHRYIMCEQKSTAMKAISRERELAIDPQATGYLWLAREAGMFLPGVPIDIVYSIASKRYPKQPKLTQKGEVSKAAIETTPQMYGQALIDSGQWPPGECGVSDATTWPAEYGDRMDAIEQNQNGLWFHRFTVHVTQDELDAFAREARHDARRLAQWKRYTSIDDFPRNWQACMAPGRSCSYVPLCRGGYRPEKDDDQLSEACSFGYRVER